MAVKQRYKISEKVDAGGMAEIFRGYAVSLDGIQKEVAVKRVRPHLAANARFVKMFVDEARLAMRLNHGNITQVFDVGRAQNTYFLVMEFVDGANVRRIMQVAAERAYRIPVEIGINIILEVCKALSHAHNAHDETGQALNIVHRDVSPPNVLVSRQGEVKITDFGLAKAATHLEATDPGVVKGKFSYLSPEACEGKEVDKRADVFSCGIILHEMLTGRRLFMGKTDLETVELVRQCKIPPPSAFNPDVGRELDEILLKTLDKDRKKRPQSADDLADMLANYLFSHGLKVTTFDLAKMMAFLFEDGVGQAFPLRVVEMVREEIINLSSMGKLPGLTAQEGVHPLDMADFQKRKTPFNDIWDEYGEDLKLSDTSVVDLKEGGKEKPVLRKGEQKKSRLGLVLALAAVGMGAAALIAYLVYSGGFNF